MITEEQKQKEEELTRADRKATQLLMQGARQAARGGVYAKNQPVMPTAQQLMGLIEGLGLEFDDNTELVMRLMEPTTVKAYVSSCLHVVPRKPGHRPTPQSSELLLRPAALPIVNAHLFYIGQCPHPACRRIHWACP